MFGGVKEVRQVVHIYRGACSNRMMSVDVECEFAVGVVGAAVEAAVGAVALD